MSNDSFDDPLITEAQIASRSPLMTMDVEYDPNALVWEWLPIKIKLKNCEKSEAADVKLSLSLDHSDSSVLHQTSKLLFYTHRTMPANSLFASYRS